MLAAKALMTIRAHLGRAAEEWALANYRAIQVDSPPSLEPCALLVWGSS